jgi:hypothetical protein
MDIARVFRNSYKRVVIFLEVSQLVRRTQFVCKALLYSLTWLLRVKAKTG